MAGGRIPWIVESIISVIIKAVIGSMFVPRRRFGVRRERPASCLRRPIRPGVRCEKVVMVVVVVGLEGMVEVKETVLPDDEHAGEQGLLIWLMEFLVVEN